MNRNHHLLRQPALLCSFYNFLCAAKNQTLLTTAPDARVPYRAGLPSIHPAAAGVGIKTNLIEVKSIKNITLMTGANI
jgi:hypothetical protein